MSFISVFIKKSDAFFDFLQINISIWKGIIFSQNLKLIV